MPAWLGPAGDTTTGSAELRTLNQRIDHLEQTLTRGRGIKIGNPEENSTGVRATARREVDSQANYDGGSW